MKMNKIFFTIIVLVCAVLIHVDLDASGYVEDDIFKEVYYNSDTESIHVMHRYTIIDQDNHIYVNAGANSFKRTSENSVSGDIYDTTKLTSGRKNVVSFTGILKSDTAQVIDYKEWGLPEAKIEISDESAVCLNANVNSMAYLKESINIEDESYIVEKNPGVNVFTVSGSGINCPASEANLFVFQLMIYDQGVTTVCTFINGDFDNYLYYEGFGKWYKNSGDSDWSSYIEDITLYDGTNGISEELPEQYQYGKKLNWQTGDLIYGLYDDMTGVLPREQIEIPSNIKSIRISYEDLFPEPKSALYMQMPGDHTNAQKIDPIQQIHDYYYYRNKTHMVSIDGEHWYDIKPGQVSPELPLKNGLNFILVVDSDVNRRSESFEGISDARDILKHLLVLYWEGEDDYTVSLNQSTKLKDLKIYRAGSDEADSLDGYYLYNISEEQNGENTVKTIDMNSAYPYLWINPVTDSPDASVVIEDSKLYLGGYFKRCSSEDDYFDIKVISEDGQSEQTYRIFINWTLAAPELKSLSVVAGGTLETAFSPEIQEYYCEKGTIGNVALSYTTSENVKTSVYVDRELKETIEGVKSKFLMVSSDVHEIRWDIESPVGKTAVVKVYFNRGTEKGVSDNTKLRAQTMVSKLIEGGYNDYLKNYEGESYWKTFGAASLGKDYLKGMLGYDVTKHEFKQASDYAGVILELVMSGENPYDYLGTNYVEKLWAYNDDGHFGPFSCDIWALTALSASGHEIPEKLIANVKAIALASGADLDIRGWALYALAPFKNTLSEKEYAKCIQSIKNVQIFHPIAVNEIDVTGCFENFWYTNRNINSHACVISGLTAIGIDVGAKEFSGENGADPVSILENYQTELGGFIYTPDNPKSNGDYNKDAVIALGDLYNGSNVYTRYYITEDVYANLVAEAEEMLEDASLENEKKEILQTVYMEAKKYLASGTSISQHGKEYYALQDVMVAINPSLSPGVFLGTDDERDKVNEVIEEINSISSYRYADKDDLDLIKEKYDSLKEERLYHYVTNYELLNKAYGYVEDIDAFLGLVEKIGQVNLTKIVMIQKAHEAYDFLSDKQKQEEKVKEAYEVLVVAEKTLLSVKSADQVIRAIQNIGSVITIDIQADIEAVRIAYEALSDQEKGYVTNLSDLEKAEQKLEKLIEEENYITNANAVAEIISDIGSVTRNSQELLQTARTAYDGLSTEEEKRLVGNYKDLLDAEKEYTNILNREALDEALSQADYLINQIFDCLDESGEFTDSADSAYNEAQIFINQQEENWPDFRWMVENYPVMLSVKEQVETEIYQEHFSEIRNAVYAIYSIGEVTWSYRAHYLEAIGAYNDLTEEVRSLLPENAVSLLSDAEETFADVQQKEQEAESVSQIITVASEIDSLSDEDLVKDARSAYDDCNCQNLISNYGLLVSTEKILRSLEKDQEDGQISGAVEDMIYDLVSVKIEDAEKVEEARLAYDALTDTQKSKVSNLKILLSAEVVIEKLKQDTKESISNATAKTSTTVSETTTSAKKNTAVIGLVRNKKSAKPYLIGKATKYTLVLKINGKKISNDKIKWCSGKKTVAFVSNGKVIVKKKGNVKITAIYNGKKYTKIFVVRGATFKIKKNIITVKKGKKYRIKYKLAPMSAIHFKSMNKRIATVSSTGIVKAKRKGVVKIRAQSNCITRYLTVRVK